MDVGFESTSHTARKTRQWRPRIDLKRQARYKPDTGQMQARYRPDTSQIQAIYKPDTGQIQARYRPDTSQIQARCKPDTSQIQARYKPNASQIHQNCHNQVLTVYVCRRSRKPSYVWAWNMLIQKGHIQIGLARTIYIYGLHSVFWQRNHQTYGHIWGILYGSGQPYIQKLGSFS